MFARIKDALEAVLFYTILVLYVVFWHYTVRFLALAVVAPYICYLKIQAHKAHTRYNEALDVLSEQYLENIVSREEFAHRFQLQENTPLFQYLVHQWYIYEDRVRRSVTNPLRDRYLDLDGRVYKIRHRLR